MTTITFYKSGGFYYGFEEQGHTGLADAMRLFLPSEMRSNKVKELVKINCFIEDEEKAKLKSLPTSLEQALDALEADHDYLTQGGVFPQELITKFIASKRAECREMAAIPHPAEFDKYFNL